MKNTGSTQAISGNPESQSPSNRSILSTYQGSDRIARTIIKLSGAMIWTQRCAAILLLVLMLLTMCSQVIARYVFVSPYSWSEELSRLLMIWMIFTAASYVMAEEGHIAVDLWSSRVSQRFRLWCDYLVHLVVIGTCLLLLIGGLPFVWYLRPVGSPSLGIPKSLWYASVSTGLLLMAVHSLLNLILLIRIGQPNRRSTAFDVDEGFHLNTDLSTDSKAPIGEPRT